jgi:mono/diheme cytochrome c family protein
MEPVMTDAAVHLAKPFVGAASRAGRLMTLLGRRLSGILLARATRRALNGLPDDMLVDIGLTRSDIPFVASQIAGTDVGARRSPGLRLALITVAVAAYVVASHAALAQTAQVKRGEYLVTLGGCTDCHTPGYFFGKPDMGRYLGGSEVGFEIPGLGVFHGPNLTPDRETGLGTWSAEEIAKAITKGQRPDGRILAPIMPWHAFAKLTDGDVAAIAAFLKSLPPVSNKVPGPFGANEKPTSFVMKIVPPQADTTANPPSK